MTIVLGLLIVAAMAAGWAAICSEGVKRNGFSLGSAVFALAALLCAAADVHGAAAADGPRRCDEHQLVCCPSGLSITQMSADSPGVLRGC